MTKITTDFVGTESAAVTKLRLTEILEGWAYDPGSYTTWGDARSDMNALLSGTAIGTIGATEIAGSFLPKINALNEPVPFLVDVSFGNGEDGSFISIPDAEIFTDTAGTTLATWGNSVARINDPSPNERHPIQANAALRAKLGRAPVDVRNLLQRTEEFDSGWILSAGATMTSNAAVAPDGTMSADRIDFADSSPSRIEQGAANGLLQTFSVWLRTVSGTLTLIVGRSAVLGQTFTVTEEWQRFSVTNVDLFAGISNGQNVAKSVFAWGAQLELGSEVTPYQRVGNTLDITESGVPSFAFLRFDLSDDVMPTVFPDGLEGDLMIFGRKGSWIQRDVSIAPGSNLNIGPTTIPNGPSGLMAALGDIVGWTAVNRTLSATEVNRLVSYHRGRGAKGLLVPGPELVVNGDFSAGGDGWDFVPGVTFSGGLATYLGGNDADRLRQFVPDLSTTAFYLMNVEVPTVRAGRPRIEWKGSGLSGTDIGFADWITANVGTRSGIIQYPGGGREISFRATNFFIGPDSHDWDVGSVSLRELIPQEEL